MDAYPPINETAFSLNEVKEAVARLRNRKAAGICNIRAEIHKAEGKVMIRGLHAVLTAVWVPFLLTVKVARERGPSGLQQLPRDNIVQHTR